MPTSSTTHLPSKRSHDCKSFPAPPPREFLRSANALSGEDEEKSAPAAGEAVSRKVVEVMRRRMRRREKTATMVRGLDRGGHGRWEASILEAVIEEDEDENVEGEEETMLCPCLCSWIWRLQDSLKRELRSSLFTPSNFEIL